MNRGRLTVFAVFAGVSVAACGSGKAGGFDRDGKEAVPQTNLSDPGGAGLGGGGPSTQPEETKTCAADVRQARRPEVDIIVVIDTSPSMDDEIREVQNNINQFANNIGGSGLDYQVIMFANKPMISLPFIPPDGICVPPPLGGPNCGDNPPRFHHLNEEVSSTDSLQLLLSEYGKYRGWLRPEAYKVFIEITDDDSTLPSDDFDRALLALQPAGMFGTSQNRKYVWNSIVGWQDGTPRLSSSKCGSAVNVGQEYQELTQLTGGVVDSVCKQSFSGVFQNLAKGLFEKVGCEFQMPTSTNGTSDPSKVVVHYTPGGTANQETLTQVTDSSKCDSVGRAWFYDNNANPTKILFCPTLCASASQDISGRVDIAVGCKAPTPK